MIPQGVIVLHGRRVLADIALIEARPFQQPYSSQMVIEGRATEQ